MCIMSCLPCFDGCDDRANKYNRAKAQGRMFKLTGHKRRVPELAGTKHVVEPGEEGMYFIQHKANEETIRPGQRRRQYKDGENCPRLGTEQLVRKQHLCMKRVPRPDPSAPPLQSWGFVTRARGEAVLAHAAEGQMYEDGGENPPAIMGTIQPPDDDALEATLESTEVDTYYIPTTARPVVRTKGDVTVNVERQDPIKGWAEAKKDWHDNRVPDRPANETGEYVQGKVRRSIYLTEIPILGYSPVLADAIEGPGDITITREVVTYVPAGVGEEADEYIEVEEVEWKEVNNPSVPNERGRSGRPMHPAAHAAPSAPKYYSSEDEDELFEDSDGDTIMYQGAGESSDGDDDIRLDLMDCEMADYVPDYMPDDVEKKLIEYFSEQSNIRVGIGDEPEEEDEYSPNIEDFKSEELDAGHDGEDEIPGTEARWSNVLLNPRLESESAVEYPTRSKSSVELETSFAEARQQEQKLREKAYREGKTDTESNELHFARSLRQATKELVTEKAKRKDSEAKRRKEIAKRKEAEAKVKEAEAKRKDAEAKRKEGEAKLEDCSSGPKTPRTLPPPMIPKSTIPKTTLIRSPSLSPPPSRSRSPPPAIIDPSTLPIPIPPPDEAADPDGSTGGFFSMRLNPDLFEPGPTTAPPDWQDPFNNSVWRPRRVGEKEKRGKVRIACDLEFDDYFNKTELEVDGGIDCGYTPHPMLRSVVKYAKIPVSRRRP